MKKHHWVMIALLTGGVLLLIYLYLKGRAASGASSGAVDTSQLPTIISTGGGSIQFPQQMQMQPQTFDTSLGMTPASVASAVNAPLYAPPSVSTPSTVQQIPNPSGGGVPVSTAQAQEFATAQPIAAPGAGTSGPSFYQPAQALPYQQINQDLVAATSGPGAATGASNPTLEAFLQQDVRSWETTPSAVLPSGGISSVLTTEAGGYCQLHPEACPGGPDQSALISNLSTSFQNFQTAKAVQNAPQPTGYVNPGIQNTVNTIIPYNPAGNTGGGPVQGAPPPQPTVWLRGLM